MPSTLALDRSSVRRVDADGHLHVERTPISKANVSPYYGREIPDSQRLGLDPNRIYRLLRDPEELKKAAPTFAGKPLLIDHQPVSSSDHPKDKITGSIGQDVRWEAPFLTAPLSVWRDDAIDGIESGKKRQLSSGYRYRADMTPGTFEGEPYDGVMRDIVGNHVALVEEGRVPDIVVGDSALRLNPWAGKFRNSASAAKREAAYIARFPDAKRLAANGFGEQVPSRAVSQSAQQAATFSRRFPNADRLKH